MKLLYLIPHIGKVMAARAAITIIALSLSTPAMSGAGAFGATPPDDKPAAVDTTTAAAADAGQQYAPIDIDTAAQQALTNSFAGEVDRVDPHSGIVRHSYVDMRLPGNGGFDLTILRTYSTQNRINQYSANKSGNALGWRIDFGRIMVPFWIDREHGRNDPNPCSDDVPSDTISTYNPILALPGKGYQSLGHAKNSSDYSTTDATKVYCPNGKASPFVLTVLTPDGMRYEMTHRSVSNMNETHVFHPRDPRQNIWHTTKIVDRNGNYININYKRNDSAEIANVTTNDGRIVYFEYINSGKDDARIKSIRAGNLVTQYEYNENNLLLKKVTLADGTAYQYDYFPEEPTVPGGAAGGSSFLMKNVTLPTGGIIEYEYAHFDFTERSTQYLLTMLTKRTKKSNDAPPAEWTYFYNEITPGEKIDDLTYPFDYTDETTPTGNNRYYFNRMLNSFSHTDHWQYGLLVKKHVDDLTAKKGSGYVRKEIYEWYRANLFVQETNGDSYFPKIFAKGYTIHQEGIDYSSIVTLVDKYHNPVTIVETGFDAATNSVTSKTMTNQYHHDVDVSKGKYDIRKLKSSVSSDGNSIANEYDGNGNLISNTNNGVTTLYRYGSDALLSEVITPDGLSHQYANYYRGVPQSESHPEGVTLSRTVDDAGNILTETDGEQHTTTYTYDGLNRARSIQLPLGALRTIDYSANQKTIRYGDSSEITTYDGFGRPTNINANGIITTMTYDAIGRKVFQSDPGSSNGTRFSYDLLNRPIQTLYSDNNFSTVSYSKGSVTTTNERRQGSYRYDYRAYGKPEQKILMAITAPEVAASIKIKRNAKDLIESVTQDGIERTYTYDARNYLTSITQPEIGKTIFGRDVSGNMTSKNIEGYLATTYAYDGQNRLKSITYPSGTPSVNYAYSKTGKLLSASTSDNTRSFAYDENDNLKSESLTIDNLTFTTSYTYNAMNALSSMTLPRSSKIIEYAPDVFGRPTQVSSYVNHVSYWPSGQMYQISYANGVESTYEQNSRLWPASFTTKKENKIHIQSHYTYDETGNLFTVKDAANPIYDRWLKYDNLDRLTTANGAWGNGTISYDGKGNIIQQNVDGNVLNYNYDTSNRLSKISGYRAAIFGYDINGNITSGTDAYTYNYASQLTCVNCSIPSKKIEYQYDGQNQRVASIKAGIKIYEIYDAAGHLILEFSPSLNNKTTEHIYLNAKRIAQRVAYQ